MRFLSRRTAFRKPLLFTLTGALALTASAVDAPPASANLQPAVIECRAAVGKAAARLAKSLTKAVAGCHKARARDASMSAVDCNDIAAADIRNLVPRAEQKFTKAVTARCAGVDPDDALYTGCPAPCGVTVPSIDTFANVAACVICLSRDHVETHGAAVHGTPASPLPGEDRRCEDAIGSSSAKLFQSIARDVTRCQARDESAGAETTAYCAGSAYPSAAVNEKVYDAASQIAESCDLTSYENLDSCSDSAFGLADCVGEATLEAAQEFVIDVLSLPVATTTTTSTTTTTTLPTGDPQCPDLGELVLFARDSNIPCTSNGDCDEPRTCNTAIGICVSLSDLDSGWTGHGHDADLDDGVVTRTHLICPGPAPVCGECLIAGVDPAPGNCRCANNTRTICDEPFVSDADDCGGATCDCYFGVPIPLSSAGTPACIVNRYSEDLTGTANVDEGSQEIAAKLRTRVYLGITTTNPCPICGGTCSNSPTTACAFDSECGAGTCNQDTPNDGNRNGICMDGDFHGQSCDVAGINPSFPARSGALPGGGGYSLDCMPAAGINISGAGLTLNVTQRTGISTLESTLPCDGGECPCKTCSASPLFPCNNDGDCTGGSCAVSSNFGCDDNADCSSLDLGTCTGIFRCSLATSVDCDTNADCQNYPSGGPCNPSTCTAIGNSGQAPSPNACTAGSCSDIGNGESQCTTGPDDKTCDGLVRADGTGVLSCVSNNDCTENDPLNGSCSLVHRRPCFPSTVVATGVADSDYPVGAAAFCVPPTSNSSINQVAGLPGPTRVVNQGRARAFCASDHGVVYESGVGGCPP